MNRNKLSMNNFDNVIFDFDETIAMTIDAIEQTLYYYNGDILKLDKPTYGRVREWNFKDIYPNVSSEIIEEMFAKKMFFDLLKPYSGMKEAMKWFKDKGKTVYILSLGTPRNLSLKADYIHKNLSGLYDQLILAGSENNLVMDKSIFNIPNSILLDDNENNLFTSPAKYKICSKLYTDETCTWNSKWNGLSFRNAEELIDMFQ